MYNKTDIRLETHRKPHYETLITFAFFSKWVEMSANYIVASILDAEHEIAPRFASKTGPIRQSGEVFLNFFRIIKAILEFEPFCFI